MPWEHPKRQPRADHTLDTEDYNDARQHVTSALGQLNEHNFDKVLKSQLALTDLEDSVCRRISVTRWPAGDPTNFGQLGITDPGDALVEALNKWAAVTELEKDVQTADGVLLITFSAQVQYGHMPWQGWTDMGDTYYLTPTYLQAALEVDGRIIPETVVGDQDRGKSGSRLEPGIVGYTLPFRITAAVPVQAGMHTIRPVFKVCTTRTFNEDGNFAEEDDRLRVVRDSLRVSAAEISIREER